MGRRAMVVATVMAAGIFLSTGQARAQSPGVMPPPAPTATQQDGVDYRYYTWQILLTDTATVLLTIATESPELFVTGYLVGPIVVHGLNGNATMAGVSPLMRAGLPAIGGAIGFAISCGTEDHGICALGALPGIGIGMATAVIVDWFHARRPRAEGVQPVALPCRSGSGACATVGLGGRW